MTIRSKRGHWAAVGLFALGGLGTPLAVPALEAQEVHRVDSVSRADRNETFPVVDPTDGALWFSVYSRGFNAQTLMRAPATSSGWGEAEVAPFSGRWGDRAARFSPDGLRLYFTSDRPRPGQDAPGDLNIWVVDRSGGEWSQPELLPGPVNSPGPDIHASITAEAIYVASRREDGKGRSDIYRIPMTGSGYGSAEPMPFNDELSQPDLLVSENERWMILVITDHPEGLGGDDLFLVRRTGDGWGRPRHLPAPVNSSEYEYGPTLSPDGRWVYFTSHRNGSADVYAVDVSALGIEGG